MYRLIYQKPAYFLSVQMAFTEVRFVSFPSGGFTTMAVMNPPEKKTGKTHLCALVGTFFQMFIVLGMYNFLECSNAEQRSMHFKCV